MGAPGPDFGTWDTTTHGQGNKGGRPAAVCRPCTFEQREDKAIKDNKSYRINNLTYVQQPAGQRMTPKTMKSSRHSINRAQRKLTMSLVQKIEHSNFRLCLPQ
jgi:hypothetical protein